jgi:hypothetical protein
MVMNMEQWYDDNNNGDDKGIPKLYKNTVSVTTTATYREQNRFYHTRSAVLCKVNIL